jgi:hypothetical protein
MAAPRGLVCRRVFGGAWMAAAFMALVTGCSRSRLPPVAKATGVVRLNGSPVAGALVRFIPDTTKGPDGRMSTGTTGTDGRFVLSCFQEGDGALVGFHRVAIVAQPRVEITGSPDAPIERLVRAAAVPARYADERTSGLAAEVATGAAAGNHFEFDIEQPAAR